GTEAAPLAAPPPSTPGDTGTAEHTGGGSDLRVAGFIGLGVGVVGFGLAGFFAFRAGKKHSDASDLYDNVYHCEVPGNCVSARRDQISSLDNEANDAKKLANL